MNQKKIRYFFCIRHVFANLKFNQFAYAIENIVKCASQEDLDNSLAFYSDLFSNVIDIELIKQRDKALSKVGLIFDDGFIKIKDDNLWEKISIFKRVQYKMPTTTNSLEAFHGQLNLRTPRRNCFWSSIHRIASHFENKCFCVQDSIKHNYVHEKKQTIAHAMKIGEQRMKSQITFYRTIINHCNCSGNKLISNIYNIDFPCCH